LGKGAESLGISALPEDTHVMHAAALILIALYQPAHAATLNETEFRDKVYACWLGKSIGGTLGAPVEGRQETHRLSFYDPMPSGQTANDDLDLQLLWLKALEERGTRIDARVLGEYWLSFVPVDWNEYGVGKTNMRDGFAPPISGQFRNERWRDSNGAWIRSEVWACVAPGCPALAARYAFEDACVDHGAAEGTYAELFTAAIESAAFVESDRDRLLGIGLSYIPPDCAVAKSIRAAMDAKKQGLDLMAAREAVVKASESTGWFMAPQNVAFTMLGWLYGDGDFGKSICAAVNCGDDTDCTGATLGSLLGILGGTKGIPERWRAPIGEGIRNVAIGNFQPPKTLSELTDRTVRMAKIVLLEQNASVRIADAPTDLSGVSLTDEATAKALWTRSPWRVPFDFVSVRATLDVLGEPWIGVDAPHTIALDLQNQTPHPLPVTLTCRLAEGLTAEPATQTVDLPPLGHEPVVVRIELRAEEIGQPVLRGCVEIAPRGRPSLGVVPFALATHVTVSKDDLALASKGATVTSDSEYERDAGGTQKAIDGVLATEWDFEGKRWHAALTPHPHWIAAHLPEAKSIGRAIIHFADPQGHPVDFLGEVSLDEQTWQTVFEETGYTDARRYEKAFTPVQARHFRLTIRKSASDRWPSAAQISEIELLPK
jgi:ADP-ribosylglycohydrolase